MEHKAFTWSKSYASAYKDLVRTQIYSMCSRYHTPWKDKLAPEKMDQRITGMMLGLKYLNYGTDFMD